MEQKLVFGLDLGINNVGWSVVQKSEQSVEVLAMGTFVFDSPLSDENKPSEGLKTKARGISRRSRRTGKRRHQRKMALYRLLVEHGFLPRSMEERVRLFCTCDPYRVRAKAIKERLEPYELGRALCHLNQRRGFLSPRDLMLWGVATFGMDDGDDDTNGEAKEETGQIKKELLRTEERMQGFQTIGAFLNHRLHNEKLPVRKKQLYIQKLNKKNKLVTTEAPKATQLKEDERRFIRFDRHMIDHEFEQILKVQSRYHSILTPQLQEKVRKAIFDQRHMAANKATRGNCVFHKKELRMPRASLTAQKFVLAQDVAHLTVAPGEGQEFRALKTEERKALLNKLMQVSELSWVKVKETVGLPITAIFNVEPVTYTNAKGKKVKQSSGTKKEMRGSQTVARIKSIIGEKWDALGEQAQRELVGEMISTRDWVGQKHEHPAAFRRLKVFKQKEYGNNKIRFTEKEANELATVELPQGYLNLSLKAAKRIIPAMLNEKSWEIKDNDGNSLTLTGPLVYSDACKAVGYDHSNPDGEMPTLDKLPFPSDDQIPNALVRTSVRSAVRVLNALHAEFGKPDAIHIELPRDLALGAKQREEVENKQKENEAIRKRIAKDLVALGFKPNSQNIKKVRLWEELGGSALAYEPEVVIPDLKSLMSEDYEVDHIVPRSHALDNSMANLTLCTRAFNSQVKGNRTPYEALNSNTEAWNKVVAHVKSIKSMPLHKRNRILAKERPDGFTGRHLAATGWISREVLKLAQMMAENKHDAVVMPGKATADFRKFWGFEDLVPLHPEERKERDAWKAFMDKAEAGEATEKDVKEAKAPRKTRSNFLHHAVDALVVALADRASLQAMSTFYQLKDSNDPSVIDKADREHAYIQALPDLVIRGKAEAALAKAEVVHRPNRRPSGELHEQTARDPSKLNVQPGEPFGSQIVGKQLVRFDHEGNPAQAYDLGSNHHVVIWESLTPNSKGTYERRAEVVPTIEAHRRRAKGEPLICKNTTQAGWKFVMALCKGDMVEMTDGTIGVVSKFSAKAKQGDAELAIWHPYVAGKLGKLNVDNSYVVAYIQTASRLREIESRIILDPLGRIVYREGARE